MRTALLLGFALALASCNSETTKQTIEVTIPTLKGERNLRMQRSRPAMRWQYRLRVKSNADRALTLSAAFAEPAPEGMSIRLAGEMRVMRDNVAEPVLILVVPRTPGPFEGTVRITSAEMPGWSTTFPFKGEVVERALEGPYLKARPVGVHLENLRPGEQRGFVFALRNVGSENVMVRDWQIADRSRMKLREVTGGELIVPGAELQVNGVLVAPRAAGRFAARVRVLSNAVNLPQGLTITISGEVFPDYAPHPTSLARRRDYPVQQSVYKLEIRAREGQAPFTIREVTGHELYFELVGKGGDAPAAAQQVEFRLKRDAPTDVRRDASFRVRFRIDPVDTMVEWPVSLRLLPPIHAEPYELNFGKVPFGTPARRELMLVTFGNRKFEVTGVKTAEGKFAVGKRHAPGLRWYIVANVTRGLTPGQHKDRILIETNDPAVPAIAVPVWVEITRSPG